MVAWVALSLLTKIGSSDPAPAAAEIKAADAPLAASEPPEEIAKTLIGRLEPPPPPGSEPAQPETSQNSDAGETGGGLISNPAAILTGPSAPLPQFEEGYQTAAGAFAPFEQALLSGESMIAAAQAMAPTISRMEPVGRKLVPADKAPPAKTPPKPKPRLTDPPNPALAPNSGQSLAADPNAIAQNGSWSQGGVALSGNISQREASGQGATAESGAMLAAAAARSQAPARPSSGRRYTVLAGSFGKSENAERLRDKFLAAGLDVQVTEVTINSKIFFRVMSGTFDDQASAEAYGRELKQRDLVDNAYIKPM